MYYLSYTFCLTHPYVPFLFLSYTVIFDWGGKVAFLQIGDIIIKAALHVFY